jgi:hypothetical protein
MRIQIVLTTLALAGLCTGCQHLFGETPKSFGIAHIEAVERMIAHPEAPEQNTEALTGVEAPTARGIVENYHEGEKRENQEQRRDRPTIIDTGR